jgi:biotin transporter BioY
VFFLRRINRRKENTMFPAVWTAPIAGLMVCSMAGVAVMDVQTGMPAEQADLIPAAQLAPGSVGSTATTTVMAGHLDMVTGADYAAAPYTTPLRLDGLTWLTR